MSPPDPRDIPAVQAAFEARLATDRDNGQVGTLQDYQAAFTGFEEVIRHAFEQHTSAAQADWAKEFAATYQADRAAGRRPNLADYLSRFPGRELEKDRQRRYQTALDLANDLRHILDRQPILARPASTLHRARRWTQRNPSAAMLMATVFLATAAGIVWTTMKNRELAGTNSKLADTNNKLADTNSKLQEALDEARWLADAKIVDRYKSMMLHLPTRDERDLPKLREWMQKAEALAARLPIHVARLEALREKARPYTETMRRRDRRNHPDFRQLSRVQRQIQSLQTKLTSLAPSAAAQRQRLEETLQEKQQFVDRVEKAMAALRSYEFQSGDTQFEHDTLQELVKQLRRFIAPEGALPIMRQALAHTETVREQTITQRQESWAVAIASIANPQECPLYRGLKIRPQVGLVPIGRNNQGLWEFAFPRLGPLPKSSTDGFEYAINTCPIFVLLPGGKVSMGCRRPDAQHPEGSPYVDPNPEVESDLLHEIELRPFFLSKFELTQAQYQYFRGDNPSLFKAGRRIANKKLTPRNPVENLTWITCKEMVDVLGLQLPTEAQWEYAVRGGTTSIWWTGNAPKSLQGAANLMDAAMVRIGGAAPGALRSVDDGHVVHAPVGSYRANGFGLHDVTGNVQEWCRDSYIGYNNPARAGDGLRAYTGERKVVRGGAFSSTPAELKSASRGSATAGTHGNTMGIRPARALQE